MEIRDPRTFAIIGASMEVHKELGPGFLEPVYHEALERELGTAQIPFEHEPPLPVFYKREPLRLTYRADFICFDEVIVELKALSALTSKEEAQILNYLKASRKEVGLLINFGTSSLEYKRFVNTKWR
jgi:GxxExxY protein